MAHIVDTRSAGGEFVVLGDALTLPTSSIASSPMQGSLRFNPVSNAVEYYNPAISQWDALSAGGPRHIDTVSGLLANASTATVGINGYALDGRKPAEVTANTTGSGVPVFFGHANAVSQSATWLSTIDAAPVQA
jgi:hypothetical protein